MKISDCFIFFNEPDLLEFRLKLLDQHVDILIVAESNLTHSEKPDPFYFEVNKKRFAPRIQKINYLQIKQTATGLDFDQEETVYNPQSAAFKLENEYRNALSAAASIVADQDLVLISDLDEIPNPFKRPGIFYKFVSVYYYPRFLRKIMQQYPDFLYKSSGTDFFKRLFYSIKKISS